MCDLAGVQRDLEATAKTLDREGWLRTGDAGYTLCVDGTQAACASDDARWQGNQCCVSDAFGQCVMGTAAGCAVAPREAILAT